MIEASQMRTFKRYFMKIFLKRPKCIVTRNFVFFGHYTTLVTYKEVEKVVQYLQNRITIRIFGSRSVFVTILLIIIVLSLGVCQLGNCCYWI